MINIKSINWKVVYKSGLGIIGMVAISFAGYFLSTKYFGRESVTDLVESVGVFGPLIIILLKISTLVFAPLGGNPIYILSGIFYGFLPGFGLVLTGDILGSVISFWLARKYGKKIVIKLTGENSTDIIDRLYLRTGEWRGLALASIFGIADFVNYVAGLTKISFWKFILVALLVRVPFDLFLISLAFFPEQPIVIKSVYGFVALIYIILVGMYWFRFYKKGAKIEAAN